ncbi:hypothetical protein YH64_021370 [Achromobacter sp. LC458]|nr:hypothetical protein YH64_021370 [Achromobacter sp. LC458]
MTATPPDPFATQHDSMTDPDATAPVDDAQTRRLREENRALRELLAAQVQAIAPPPPPQPEPSCIRRIGWALISAPGAALVGWRALLGRDDDAPITGRKVGSATLTVLYTLAIYAALVLLVVSWNAPNNGITGPDATPASSGRVPLTRLPLQPADGSPSDWETAGSTPVPAPNLQPAPSSDAMPADVTPVPHEDPSSSEALNGATIGASSSTSNNASSSSSNSAPHDASNEASIAASAASSNTTPSAAPPATSSAPKSTLRITEIPAVNPLAWVDTLQGELARCAELGFFERPDCAWEARRQFCEPNQGWGVVKECPAQP